MPAAVPQKFRFDLDLGHREEKNRVVTESAMDAMIAQARAAGYAEGAAAGEQRATATAARQLAAAATALGERVAAFAAELDTMREQTLREAVELAAAIARKLASSLVSQRPAAEIEGLIAECLGSIGAAPHLVVRCHPDLCDAVREIATERAAVTGFAGRLVVLGEPEIALGNCRLEWIDGGLVRDMDALVAEVDRRVGDYIAARSVNNGAQSAGEQQK